MTIQLGYCTNVHAGADLKQTRANLERHALAVKRRFSPERPMGIGLWLSSTAARNLLQGQELPEFTHWLKDVGLVPFTLNGFPHGDFHQAVVKHRVYLPTWFEPARFEYTVDLITILDALLPPGLDGSISTLPIAWGTPRPGEEQLSEAGRALSAIAARLAHLEQERGRRICLCLEPEPGCVFDRSADAVRFFEEYVLPGANEAAVRRHLGICHDVCHAAVMFEEQATALLNYQEAGIAVGKVQVSSAVALPLDGFTAEERAAALRQLAGFAEDRYLHQTLVRARPESDPVFYEDLPLALAAADPESLCGEWRVHFHVPIYLREFGRLKALQDQLLECLRIARLQNLSTHYEVETYAWGVLPPELRQPDLATGIAEEMNWFQAKWEA